MALVMNCASVLLFGHVRHGYQA